MITVITRSKSPPPLKAGQQAKGRQGQNHRRCSRRTVSTRLHSLFADFCKCFNDADIVIVADVYAAGEHPIEGVNRDALVEGLKAHGHRGVHALPDPTQLAPMIAELAAPDDYVICLGAGSISGWAHALPAELEKLLAAQTRKAAS